jgi:hypothetical protein
MRVVEFVYRVECHEESVVCDMGLIKMSFTKRRIPGGSEIFRTCPDRT